MALEYCWTRTAPAEEDNPPGLGWQYYGAYIRGGFPEPVYRLTRWARERGETSYFVGEPILLPPDRYHTHTGYRNPDCNVTPPVTPPEIPPDDNSPSARLARALQLLKS